MKKNLISIALLAAASFSANADNIVISTFSIHSEKSYAGTEYNNTNPGIGYEVVIDDKEDYVAGAYVLKNSFNNTSLALGVNKKVFTSKGFDASLGLIAATGYEPIEMIPGGIMVSPIAAVQYKNFRLATSAPFGSMAGIADFVNLQLVFKL